MAAEAVTRSNVSKTLIQVMWHCSAMSKAKVDRGMSFLKASHFAMHCQPPSKRFSQYWRHAGVSPSLHVRQCDPHGVEGLLARGKKHEVSAARVVSPG